MNSIFARYEMLIDLPATFLLQKNTWFVKNSISNQIRIGADLMWIWKRKYSSIINYLLRIGEKLRKIMHFAKWYDHFYWQIAYLTFLPPEPKMKTFLRYWSKVNSLNSFTQKLLLKNDPEKSSLKSTFSCKSGQVLYLQNWYWLNGT